MQSLSPGTEQAPVLQDEVNLNKDIEIPRENVIFVRRRITNNKKHNVDRRNGESKPWPRSHNFPTNWNLWQSLPTLGQTPQFFQGLSLMPESLHKPKTLVFLKSLQWLFYGLRFSFTKFCMTPLVSLCNLNSPFLEYHTEKLFNREPKVDSLLVTC